jgi:mitochondrial fission protein ELM1
MSRHRSRPKGIRAIPEKIVLEVIEGIVSSAKPPVRIFIGSEAAQGRAERILIWSIERVRDPGRVYEIFLMKELSGFDRQRWLTGFTNYRFAIPEFSGNCGRAIYNDVDQIYLTDPGELFDHDLQEHGFLTIAPNDTSVMLMDCKKMASVWSLESAKFEKKNTLVQQALDVPNLWGKLEPEWNARDEEYRVGQSKVLHYTALHTQPWQPFPQEFVYQKSPVGDVWFNLEQSANQRGFHLFSKSCPSSLFTAFAKQATDLQKFSPQRSTLQNVETVHDLEEAIPTLRAKTLLYCHFGGLGNLVPEYVESTSLSSLTMTAWDLLHQDPGSLPSQQFDIVLSPGGLHLIPDEDIPWVMEEMFHRANGMVYVAIESTNCDQSYPETTSQSRLNRDFNWWMSHLESISARYPGIHWKLVCNTTTSKGIPQRLIRCGGKWIGFPPRIWILSDGKVGHTTQSEVLAKSLGWPYEIKQLRFYGWHKVQKFLWGLFPPNTLGLDRAHSSPLGPPWPDFVISTGWRPAPIARWIREQSQGKSRIIQLGRKGGCSADLFDVVITPTYYGFPPHPHRIETLAPLNGLTQESLETVRRRWPNLFDDAPHPRIVLVVGGATTRFKFTSDMARRIGEQLKDLAEKCNGKIFAVTSPRTGEEVAQALESTLIPNHHVHKWSPDQADNPYLAFLAGADVIIVTGESESMLAEAASLGKAVYIIPLEENPPTWNIRLSQGIVQRAQSQPLNKRGTVRPQQGLERFCARLIRSGLVQPRRDLSKLHDSLINKGIARPFGEPIENGQRPQLRETETVAKRIKEVLGIFDHGTSAR